MAKQPSISDYALERVGHLFSEEKKRLPSHSSNEKNFAASHSCERIKLYKILSTLERLLKDASKSSTKKQYSLDKATLWSIEKSEKEASLSSLNAAAAHAHHCCVNQKHPSFVLMKNYSDKGVDLSSHQIKNACHNKEHILASKKLKNFSKESEASNHPKHDVKVLPNANTKKEDFSQNQAWENLIKSKEERHFQVRNVSS